MSKRKILLLASALLMVAVLGIGGTMAYFTDADKDVNVMYTGNIKIVQNETERDGTAYEDGQLLAPAVYFDENGNPYNPTTGWEGPKGGTDTAVTGPDGNTLKVYGDNITNEIDKIISVTNNGTLPAYIRTIVLMENTADNAICAKIHGLWSNSDGQYRKWLTNADGSEVQVTIDGVTYSVAVCTYNSPLAAGATSAPSLVQVWLDPSTTNAWYDLLGDGQFSIIALSQAVQVVGFEDVGSAAALNTAFGEVTAENVTKWVAETNVDTTGALNVVK